MWFSNIRIYKLKDSASIDIAKLSLQLEQDAYSPCKSQELVKIGWKEPLVGSDQFFYQVGHDLLLTMQKEEKILPATVIKQELEAKVSQLEEAQNRKLSKAEKKNLKEEIIITLLPRAFSRFSQTSLWIDTKNSRIIVNTSSAKRAEEVLSLLRKSITSLPVVPYTPEKPLENTTTNWLLEDQLPQCFGYLDEVELRSIEQDGAIVRCKHHELQSDEILLHINNGKLISQVGLCWREKIEFILTSECALKRIKFTDILKEENADIRKEDYAQKFDADFVLFTREISLLIDELLFYI